jgi:hypothetical protein
VRVHYRPESKAQPKTWKCTGCNLEKEFKTTRGPGKLMAAVFWDKHGFSLVDFAPLGAPTNAVSLSWLADRT